VNAFDRLRFKCSREECQAEIVVDGLLTNSGDAEEVSRDQNLSFQLLKCSRADCDGKPFEELGRLCNLLTLGSRAFISKYYQVKIAIRFILKFFIKRFLAIMTNRGP
jgi:hypothetical protein